MTTSLRYVAPDLEYPSSDGLPMAESDAARDYLIYGVEALSLHLQKCENHLKCLLKNFFIVKRVFYALYLLIGFMPFAGYQNNVALAA